MDRNYLLGKLPAFKNSSLLIKKEQTVSDIVGEVLAAHEAFAKDYELIAGDFWRGNALDTARGLFTFLKNNIVYEVEGDDVQTTKSPAAILAMGHGDCKHYAGFIAGILDALNRMGAGIDWTYRFAGYSGSRTPEHVFVVLKENGRDYWIDPVLKTFNERLRPSVFIDKKPKSMALMRISGLADLLTDNEPANMPISQLLDNTDPHSEIYGAVQTLLKYGAMDAEARVNDWVIDEYKNRPEIYSQLIDARMKIEAGALNGLFSSIWRGVKKVTLAVPRNAYLSLVGINAFGYATKLKDAIYNPDGSFTPFKDKIKTLWQDRFGGDFSALLNTINKGATHRAILGKTEEPEEKIAGPEIPAWVAAASAIIAALTPILTAALNAKKSQMPGYNPYIDPATGLPYGMPDVKNRSGILDFIAGNPLLLIGGAAAVYFITQKKRA